LQEWEAGEVKPSWYEWQRLAEVLRRPSAAFFLPGPLEPRQLDAVDRLSALIEDAVSELFIEARETIQSAE
jgi:hypothetical protein